jgi:hypothetical protein
MVKTISDCYDDDVPAQQAEMSTHRRGALACDSGKRREVVRQDDDTPYCRGLRPCHDRSPPVSLHGGARITCSLYMRAG